MWASKSMWFSSRERGPTPFIPTCTRTGTFLATRQRLRNTWEESCSTKAATMQKLRPGGRLQLEGFTRLENSGQGDAVVFDAMVRNAALSALECLVLSDAERRSLDSTVFKFARKVLRGSACHKIESEDGACRYHAVRDADIFRILRQRDWSCKFAGCSIGSQLQHDRICTGWFSPLCLGISSLSLAVFYLTVPFVQVQTLGQSNWKQICRLYLNWTLPVVAFSYYSQTTGWIFAD